jgi:hypothetical protein
MNFETLKEDEIYFSNALQLNFQVIVNCQRLVFEDGVTWNFSEINQPMSGKLIQMLHMMKKKLKIKEIPASLSTMLK